ncbi:MAG: TonB-dependent receptor plug domain-containing protein, partial [Woeseiaceae bacterium]
MLRKLAIAALLVAAAGPAAWGQAAPYLGRSVAGVIDEFRSAGHPFAYSTNLVPPELAVTIEPSASDAADILRQILAPHGLTLRHDSGVYLVVRVPAAGTTGQLLLIVRARVDDRPIDDAVLSAAPPLPEGSRIAPGVYRFVGVPPGRYRLDVDATGFAGERRFVTVPGGEATVERAALETAGAEIETITAAASRYEIARDVAASRFLLDRRSIQTMPDVGEDPLRATQRLPGAAASGASARTHFRGGEQGEIGIILNGQRLFDPFHVRDYQNIFSAIDARAIEGVEVFTGGFPVRYGDRMSGVVLMESLEAERQRHTELGLSVFNTSVLTAGADARRRWLFSARRGNLDLILDPQYGNPFYYDVFGEFAFDLTANTTLSMNALYAD